IVSLALMIGWAAHSSWRHVEHLGERLTRVQIESFQTADQFRASLQALDSMLLRYERHREPGDRDRFLHEWKKMDAWIDVQRPTLTTPREGQLLDQINAAYDDYYAAATNLLNKIEGKPSNVESDAAGLVRVERESSRLLGLGYQLVDAHRDSLSRFLDDSRQNLFYLRARLVGALLVLLAVGFWLAVVVYREMIAPLEVKLVESRAIIERQEKLASLGMLAAGVAHEIRNPLTAIKARLFTQQKKLRAGSGEHEDAAFIGQEINRLERIVRDFLEFARPSEPQFADITADAPLREAAALLAPQLEKRRIHLNLDGASALPLHADPQQIKQVLINLVQNGADAIGEGGEITLRARRDFATLNGQLLAVAILEVADTGMGIPPAVEKRLFDPFFTTKENGTGLGLSISARIIEKHGGALQYQTQAGRGTTFGIVLPLAETHAKNGANSPH
ncbi:MAG: hypothetical protein HY300_20125, partial [Verrucomicrobia bacterium]|nr:hypothetical protein [Verrucomicrobiota bacterium]